MDASRFAYLCHVLAGARVRRHALVALLPGAAVLLAATAGSDVAAKKRKKKKCKADTNECLAQTEPCISVVTRKCDGLPAPADPEQCKAEYLPCCDFLANCNSAAAMECILQDG